MKDDRKSARALQGAKISLGGVPLGTGKWLNDYQPHEIAYLVAVLMYENAEDDHGRRVYMGGVGKAINALWPNADFTSGLTKLVSRKLHAWGYSPAGVGWAVPTNRPLVDTDGATKKQREQAAEQTTGGEVQTKWACTACEKVFDSRPARDGHFRIHQRPASTEPTPEPEATKPAPQPEKGLTAHVDVRVTPRRTVRMTVAQKQVLDAVLAEPGLHPYEYAERLGIPSNSLTQRAKPLRQQYAITV